MDTETPRRTEDHASAARDAASSSAARRRVCFILGTRPEVIKCWPVIQRMRTDPRFEVSTVLTGQHRELVDQAVRLLDIPVSTDLHVMTEGQTLEHLTAVLTERIASALAARKPDWVLVQGDTTSALIGALTAYYAGIPVAHLEAGLRTHDAREPFPEEMNRRLIAPLADAHFAPTRAARTTLVRENIPADLVWLTGNTGVDAIRIMAEELDQHAVDPALARALEEAAPRVLAVTMHRRENRRVMTGVAEALLEITRRHRDVSIIFPVHPGPDVRAAFGPILGGRERCHLIRPLDYSNFVRLLARCTCVLTDSGGVQEEAPYLGKPVLVLRARTERPEAVRAGTARVVGPHPARIIDAVSDVLGDEACYARMSRAISPYGDGHAARRIVEVLAGAARRRRRSRAGNGRAHADAVIPTRAPGVHRADRVATPVSPFASMGEEAATPV